MKHNSTEKVIRIERLTRSRLANYLDGKTSLQAFRRWFIPATWDIQEWAPAHLQELVYEIKLRLAEYSNGHWTKGELHRKLSTIVGSSKVGEKKEGRKATSSATIMGTTAVGSKRHSKSGKPSRGSAGRPVKPS